MRIEAYITPSNRKTVIVFAILMVFGLGALLFEGRSAAASLQSGGMSVLGGAQRGVASIGSFLTDTISSIQELGRLREQYDLLADRLHSLEENIIDIEELYIENQRLREALQFSSALQYTNIPAQVIAKDPGNLFGTITINKGESHGVHAGSPVIAIQDGRQGLVGRIMHSGQFTSIVQPMFDSHSHVAARIQESRHEGIASGTGRVDSPLELQFIPQRARNDIRTGDAIVTSGMSLLFPAGILIGTVTSMQSMPFESSLTIELEPIIDFTRLELVYVLHEVAVSGDNS